MASVSVVDSKTVISEEDKQKALEIIKVARGRLSFRHPFLAVLALNLNPVHMEGSNKTMAVDSAGNLYYSVPFVLGVDAKYNRQEGGGVEAVVAHEAMHAALKHAFKVRVGSRDLKRWNIAADMVVNAMVHSLGFSLIDDAIRNDAALTLSVEEVYNMLEKEASKYDSLKLPSPDLIVCVPGNGESSGKDENSLEDRDEDYWDGVLVQAATAAKMQGKLPECLQRYVDGLINREVPWQQILLRTVSNVLNTDYSFSRPNRRFISQGLYLPGPVKDGFDLVVAVDTSGSIGEKELSACLGDVRRLVAKYPNVSGTVVSCDADVHDVIDLKKWTFTKSKLRGGGGTSFVPVFDLIKKKYSRCKLLVYFTDLYGEFPSKKPQGFQTVWVTSTKGLSVPFGKVIRVKEVGGSG